MRYLMGSLWCQADITHNGKTALRSTSAGIRTVRADAGQPPRVIGLIERAGHFSSMRTRELNGGRWGLDVYGTNGVISIKLDPFSRKPPVKPTPETVRNAIIPEALWLDDSSWMARIGPDGAPLSAWRPLPEAPPIAVGDPSRERHALIVADLVEAIASDREPVASIRDSLKAQEMIQALFEAYVQGRRVTFPLEQRDHPLKRWA